MKQCFGQARDAEIYLSQPGLGPILGARVLGEFGDDPHRYSSGKARKNYAATSPLTRASGKKKVVVARFIRNDRLTGALMAQALSALGSSPGARAFYDAQRRRHRAQRRPAQARQPARRHPARMPQDPHPLRRGNRLVPPRKQACRLTFKPLGCLLRPDMSPVGRDRAGVIRCRR